jgi:hypothetical protein
VRVDLATAAVSLTEICGLPNGVIANPPLIDPARRIAVGCDRGNGVLAAFDIAADGSTLLRWRRDQNHASHLLLLADTGELITNGHDVDRMADQFVVLDIGTGGEQLRVDRGSPAQSVLFPSIGWNGDVYYCSFATSAPLPTNLGAGVLCRQPVGAGPPCGTRSRAPSSPASDWVPRTPPAWRGSARRRVGEVGVPVDEFEVGWVG